jgi:hypothetical protein
VQGGSKIQIDNDNNGIVDPCRFETKPICCGLLGFLLAVDARRRWSDAASAACVLIDVIFAATGARGRWMTFFSLDFISEECGNGGGCWAVANATVGRNVERLLNAPFKCPVDEHLHKFKSVGGRLN